MRRTQREAQLHGNLVYAREGRINSFSLNLGQTSIKPSGKDRNGGTGAGVSALLTSALADRGRLS